MTVHNIKYIDPAGLPQDLAVIIPAQKITVIRPEDEVEIKLEVCNIISITKAKIDKPKEEPLKTK